MRLTKQDEIYQVIYELINKIVSKIKIDTRGAKPIYDIKTFINVQGCKNNEYYLQY